MKKSIFFINLFIFFIILFGCARANEDLGIEKTEPQVTESSSFEISNSGLIHDNSDAEDKTDSGLENIMNDNQEIGDTKKNMKEKMIALTFDDGPEATNTPKLLELLKKEEVPATFFLLGQNVEKYPKIVEEISSNGHAIGSHTYDHKDMITLDESEMNDEIMKNDQIINKITGETPKYFRPPYGSINTKAAKLINRPIIQWSVDSEDWKTKNTQMIVNKVTSSAYDGSIVLLHDIHKETIAAVPEIIRILKKDGYQFVTLNTLLDNPSTNDMYYGENDHRPIG